MLLIAVLAACGVVITLRAASTAHGDFDTYYDVCGSEVTVTMTMTVGLGNEQSIGMPALKTLEFQCPLGRYAGDAQPAALVLATVNSDAPWVFVSGDLVFNGEMDAEGSGSIGGAQDVHAVFHADITLAGHIEGTYTLGDDGSLVTGDPSTYEFEGNFFEEPSTPTPTQAPGAQVVWGNNNCSDGAPDPVDSLLALRFDGGLSTNTGACPGMGAQVEVTTGSPHLWGDVDCSDSVDPIDSLKLLRYDGGLSNTPVTGCPAIGDEVEISGG